jgi:uncharacterized protein YecE (DUF72 family)
MSQAHVKRKDKGDVTARDGRSGLRIGCAGWSLSSKVAAAFPGDGSHLERYARVFPCVEINSSFYRPHQEKTYRRWAESVPGTFRFSVKLPRTITHERRLRDCDDALASFVQQASGLGTTLGCVLVQLPPSLALDVGIATAFFSALRRSIHVPVACEPRHASWFTDRGAAVFQEAAVACVWAHPSPVAGADVRDDGGMVYLRLHGAPHVYYSPYDDTFIQTIAERLAQARASGKDAWCIFDNTARGEAVPNALSLLGHRA